MAQTGYTPILIYSSSTTTNAPAAGSLTNSTLGSELAINITDGKLFYKDNANAVQVIAWKTTPTTAGGTGLTSYTAGDLLYYATGTTLSKLAIGASTYVLTSSGTAPQWTAPSSVAIGTATNLAGGAAGSVPYQSGAGATTFVSIGSAYQALQVNAGGTAPSWQASATSTLTTQGDLLYASAANTLARLAKNTTATRYLANTGTSNNPAWAQVDLTNGVTGTLPVGNGGTGLASYTANRILYASGSTTISTSAGLTFDGTNFATTGSATATSFIPSSSTVPTNGMYLSTTNEVSIATNSTQRVKFDATGNMSFTTADAGVVFNKTSSLVNSTLNDYETGTWTPVLTGDGGGSGQSYTTQSGTYSKIGRIVTVSFYINLSAKGTITGNAIINNLPFTVINSGSNIMGNVLSLWSNLAVNHYVLGGYCNNNSTNFYFWGSTAAAAAPPLLTTTDIGNTTRFWGSVTYIAAS